MNGKLLTICAAMAVATTAAKAQTYNPYKSIGREARVLTLSNGKYEEFFDTDTLEVIGSAILNTKTMKVIGFVVVDTLYPEASLEPELVSRWLSPDPLAAKYPSLSPYNFVANSPIYFVDPDGREIHVHFENDNGEPQVIVYTAGMVANSGNDFADRVIGSLNYLHKNNYGKSNEMISYVENHTEVVNIVQDDNNYWDRYSGTLHWNDQKWAKTNAPNTKTGSTERPPAGGLAHELSHVFLTLKAKDEYSKGNTEKADDLWSASMEETIIIPQYENQINLDAGWGLRVDKPNQTAHQGVNYYTVDENVCPYCSTGDLPRQEVE